MERERGEGEEEAEVLRFIYLTNKKKKSISPVGPAAARAHCTLTKLGSNKIA